MRISCARAGNKGSDSIESIYRRQNETGGVRQDTVLVNEEEHPFTPVRDVPRKTEISGTGIQSFPGKKPEKPGGDDDGN
jgi:hypothetical protein